jgi:hypothetical protein
VLRAKAPTLKGGEVFWYFFFFFLNHIFLFSDSRVRAASATEIKKKQKNNHTYTPSSPPKKKSGTQLATARRHLAAAGLAQRERRGQEPRRLGVVAVELRLAPGIVLVGAPLRRREILQIGELLAVHGSDQVPGSGGEKREYEGDISRVGK